MAMPVSNIQNMCSEEKGSAVPLITIYTVYTQGYCSKYGFI